MNGSFQSRMAAAIGLSLTVAACAAPRVALPMSAAGIACAEACDVTRNTCVSDAQSRALSDEQTCGNDGEVQTCLDHAVDDRTHQACEARRQVCYPQPVESGPCAEARTLCVLRCGGRLLED